MMRGDGEGKGETDPSQLSEKNIGNDKFNCINQLQDKHQNQNNYQEITVHFMTNEVTFHLSKA